MRMTPEPQSGMGAGGRLTDKDTTPHASGSACWSGVFHFYDVMCRTLRVDVKINPVIAVES